MDPDLNSADILFLLESLSYARRAFEASSTQESYTSRREKREEFDAIEAKLRALRDGLIDEGQR